MTSATLDDKTEKVGVTLPIVLVKQIEKVRGDIPRSTFIRRAVKQYNTIGLILLLDEGLAPMLQMKLPRVQYFLSPQSV
jgi:hypothetical protein